MSYPIKILGEPENKKKLIDILGEPTLKKKDEIGVGTVLASEEDLESRLPSPSSQLPQQKQIDSKEKLTGLHLNSAKPLNYTPLDNKVDTDSIDLVSKMEAVKPLKDDNVDSGYLGGTVNSLYKAMSNTFNFWGDVFTDVDDFLGGVPGYLIAKGQPLNPTAQAKAALQEQYFKEKDPEKKKQLGTAINDIRRSNNPTHMLADWYSSSAESFKPMPEGVAGDIMTGVVGVVPLLLELAATPEVKLGKIAGQAVNIPKLGTLEGVKGYYSGTKIEGTNKEKLKSGILSGVSGVGYGTVLHGLGVGSEMIGGIVGAVTKSAILKGATSAVANGLGFGGLDAYEQYVTNGEINTDRVLASIGTGVGLSIYGLPGIVSDAKRIQRNIEKTAINKAFNNFMSSSPETIDFVNKQNIDPVKLREESNKLGELAEKATDVNEKNKYLTEKRIIDNMLDIHAISKDVILHPDNYRDVINNSSLDEKVKDHHLKKIEKIVANNAELQSLRDDEILSSRENAEFKEPELFLDKGTKDVFDALDAKVPISNERLHAASDNLLNEYQRLDALKVSDSDRFNTIGEINESQAFLEKEITNLENRKNEQRETGMFLRSRGRTNKTPTKEELKEQGYSDKKIDNLMEQSKPSAKEKFNEVLEEEMTAEDKEMAEKYAKFGNADNELEAKNEPLPSNEAKAPIIESNVEPKGNAKDIILYHGTLSDINEFRPNTHFGSLEQAKNRLDYTKQISNKFREKGNIIPVIATVDKVKEVADADYNWEGVINKAKEEGYDAIKYINKGEVDVRKGKEDYSYIIFDPRNIRKIKSESEQKINETGGKENAIQEQETGKVDVGKQAGDSPKMGEGNAPLGENVKAPQEKIDYGVLKTSNDFSKALETEITQTRQEKLSEKEIEVKDRLAERLSKLSGSKFAAGDKKPEVAKEIMGVISDLAELGLIKVEKGIDHIIEQVKKYLPQITNEDINKYKDDIKGFVKGPRFSGIKKSLVPESKIEETEIEKRTIEGVMEEGRRQVDDGIINPKALVDEINKNPRAIQAEEVGSLIYYKTQLDNKFDEAYDRLSEAKSKGEDEGSAKMILDAVNMDINAFHEAALNSGYEQGLSFRLRQALLDSEYNLTTQIRKYQKANNGEIPRDVEAKFKEYDIKLQELGKQLRDINRQKESDASKEVVRNIRESNKPINRIRGKALMAEGFDELVSALGGKTMAMGETAPSVTKALSKIGRGLIDEGIATIDNVMQKISDYLTDKKIDVDLNKYKDQIIGGIREVSGIKVNDKGKTIVPHDLIREYVEKGVDDINDLVTAIKTDYGLTMPDRELRDNITNYGKTISMNKEDIEVKIREMRRVGRTLSGLDDVLKEKKKPLRSGLQRDKLTDKERRLQKDLKEAMKTLPITEEESAEAWKTTLGAVKTRLTNQITDLEHQIATGKKPVNKKGIEYDAEANALKDHRDALKQLIEETEGKTEISDEQKVRKAISGAEKLITEYERRIKEKDFSKLNKPSTTPNTPALEATKDRLKNIRDTYQKLKDLSGATEQARLDRLKENIKKSIKEHERRIKERDYSKKTRTKPELDMEASRLEIERAKIKYRYDADIERARLKNRGFLEKSKEIFMDIFNLPKSLMASADFSAPLRQGAILTFGNLRQAPGVFKEMFKQTFSAKKAEEWFQKLHATDEYVLIRNSKLYISEPTAKLAAKEEQFMTNLAHKIPIWGRVVSGSERAYVGYLNKLRVDVFNKGAKHLLDEGYTFKSNPEVFKSWADFVNNATGRGGLGPMEKSASVLNTAFFSPRFVMSRINLLNPVKYVTMPKPVRMMAMKNMLSFVGAVMTVTALSKLAGAEVEDDPRSSDFGKIKIGRLRFDMVAGFQQPIRAFFQIWTGQRKSAGTGIVRDLDSDKFPYTSRGDVVTQFVRSKLSPSASLIVDLLEGQTMLGEDIKAKNLALDRVIPLYLQDMGAIYKEEGITLTGVAALLSLFGVGVQYYEERNVARQAISDQLTWEQTKAKAQAKEEKPLSETKISSLYKEYKAYQKFGLDNEHVNFLLQSGMTNEDKARYLIDEKIDSATITQYSSYKLISSDLYKVYQSLKKTKP
jgi:hypothetical protein